MGTTLTEAAMPPVDPAAYRVEALVPGGDPEWFVARPPDGFAYLVKRLAGIGYLLMPMGESDVAELHRLAEAGYGRFHAFLGRDPRWRPVYVATGPAANAAGYQWQRIRFEAIPNWLEGEGETG